MRPQAFCPVLSWSRVSGHLGQNEVGRIKPHNPRPRGPSFWFSAPRACHCPRRVRSGVPGVDCEKVAPSVCWLIRKKCHSRKIEGVWQTRDPTKRSAQSEVVRFVAADFILSRVNNDPTPIQHRTECLRWDEKSHHLRPMGALSGSSSLPGPFGASRHSLSAGDAS